ncbi:hypothetical protein HAX54_046952 [Datura stramonium]|uniref:NPH3 domain-containing protein n=1 Tax=Datura stramonium TaxID=4076 RepID=A0ABS8RQN5_DATST|nr:hypothetical protein [Datura stramonium]
MAQTDHPISKAKHVSFVLGLPSDIIIEVEDMTFHLHKVAKLHEMITEQETKTSSSKIQKPVERDNDGDCDEEIEEEDEENEEDQQCCISLPDFPGGSETFETAAKFCYGVKIELSASNVAPLRCAGETVLKSIKDSIRTLNSCKNILPLAETLGIVQRCIDAVAVRSSAADPSLFGWPVNDGAGNGVEANTRRKGANRAGGMDSWFEELGHLSLPLFKRLISAMKGISRSSRKTSSSSIPSENEQRELLETIITYLPEETSSRTSTTTRILFGLLRTANILNASEAARAALERKGGSQLEQATLDDLLIPSYSYLNETLYDLLHLPDQARLFDDGLYRAVDVYLKAHPWISEAEREQICGVMDCQKLTLEACTHAAQNERLPLRAVVQVLFFEQLQLRQAIAGTLMVADVAPGEVPRVSILEGGEGDGEGGEQEETTGVVKEWHVYRKGVARGGAQ